MAAISSRTDTHLYSIAQSVLADIQDVSTKLRKKWRDMALNTSSSQTHFFEAILVGGCSY